MIKKVTLCCCCIILIHLLSTVTYANGYSESDLKYLSAIVYAEAGNQCEAGQQAVAIVVMNRVESDEFPDTIYNVLYQSGQFTPARNGSLNNALWLYENGNLPSSCIAAAKYALNGNKTVYYNGYTYNLTGIYYFSGYIYNYKFTIQDHCFK